MIGPLASVTLAAVLLSGCAGGGGGGEPLHPPGDEPFIEGRVTHVAPVRSVTENCVEPDAADPDAAVSDDDPPVCTTGDDGPGSILVRSPGGSDQASLRVMTHTTVLKKVSGGYESAVFGELRVGQTVTAWVSGPVAESFPVQATADTIVINPT